MPRNIRMVSASACIVLLLLALAAGCTTPATAPAAQPVQPSPSATPNTIAIKDFVFSPSSLTVKAGTTVTWVNQGSATHSVDADKSSNLQFSSGLLQNGGSYSFTFTTPGTYPFHCSVHPSMVGTITVV